MLILKASIRHVDCLSCLQCTSCSGSENSTTCANSTLNTVRVKLAFVYFYILLKDSYFIYISKCIKTNMQFPSFSYTMKGCVTSSQCSAQSFTFFSWGFAISCCTSDGCNKSSPLVVSKLLISIEILFFIFFLMLKL